MLEKLDCCGKGAYVGHGAGHSGAHGRSESRPAVEAEPAEPEEDCSKDDIGGIVGLVREALGAPALALAQVDGNRKASGTRGDVHGGTTCEIEAAGDEDPSGGVPGPACNGVVYECGPDEYEDEEGPEAGAFCYGADGEDRAVRSRIIRGSGLQIRGRSGKGDFISLET